MSYSLDDQGSILSTGPISIIAAMSRLALEAIQWVLDALLPGVKPRSESDNSLQSSAEVKNVWNCTFSPLYVFMMWYWIKHRDSFTFLLLVMSGMFVATHCLINHIHMAAHPRCISHSL
jgi:hypothetical protein